MKFSLKEWRRIYDEVHALGKILQDSRPIFIKRGVTLPPKTSLTEEMQDAIDYKITLLLRKARRYLNFHGKPAPKMLWRYNVQDPTTHLSSPEFKYGHLLKQD